MFQTKYIWCIGLNPIVEVEGMTIGCKFIKEPKIKLDSDENYKFFYICFFLTFKKLINQSQLC
jgi:hypothetical protein